MDGITELLAFQGFARSLDRLGEASLLGLEAVLEVRGAFGRRPVGLGPLHAWVDQTPLRKLMQHLLGEEARVVRAFYLDKTAEQNWAFAWHQDTTLAFAEPLEVPGFSAWVNKAHFFHAQAPSEVMEGMLSTRIHLDTTGEGQGPLKVLPGTHRLGKLSDVEIQVLAASAPEVLLEAERGEILLMRPLLLHGSHRASLPQHRRILHLEWAAFQPPGGLRWAWF